jgi:hypothetical protein
VLRAAELPATAPVVSSTSSAVDRRSPMRERPGMPRARTTGERKREAQRVSPAPGATRLSQRALAQAFNVAPPPRDFLFERRTLLGVIAVGSSAREP